MSPVNRPDPAPTTRLAREPASSGLRRIAWIAGLIAALMALATPFLPVKQTTTAFDWAQAPTADSAVNPADLTVGNVTAPLSRFVPLTVDAELQCSAIREAVGDRAEGTAFTLLATAPAIAGDDARQRGLSVSVDDAGLAIRSRGVEVALLPAGVDCATLRVHSDEQSTTATFTGIDAASIPKTSGIDKDAIDDDGTWVATLGGDWRPQVVGLFTDTTGVSTEDFSAHVDVDSRYSTMAAPIKFVAMGLGVIAAVIALIALARLDLGDGRRHRRFLPARWWKIGFIDVAVVGTLLVWHVFGAGTSDDGYVLGEARAAEASGYMPELFRYFDAPYAPFGMPYYLVTVMANVSVSTVWLRLPTLLMALVCWWVLSREALPRLGLRRPTKPVRAISAAETPQTTSSQAAPSQAHSSQATNRAAVVSVAYWAAAALFVLFWATYNNGLRPEPWVAFGSILAWCSVERAIATRRVLPLAVAFLFAGVAIAAAPSGALAYAAVLVAIVPVCRLIAASAARIGWLATLLPLLASLGAVGFVIFFDHTIGEMRESTKLLDQVGPSLSWFEEYARYDALLENSGANGAISRRFAVLAVFAALTLSTFVLLRRGKIPGLANGPVRRVLAMIGVSLALMMFVPTKWTHHFGAFAAVAGMVIAIVTVAAGQSVLRSASKRWAAGALVVFVAALSFQASNAWNYFSNFGVPFGGGAPDIAGVRFSEILLIATGACVAVAIVLHVREQNGARAIQTPRWVPRPRWAGNPRVVAWRQAPLAMFSMIVLVFTVFSLLAAFVVQSPAYSIGRQGLDSLRGKNCGLATAILAEPDANAGLLAPVTGSAAAAFTDRSGTGFTPDGIATDLTSILGDAPDIMSTGDADRAAANTGGTGGGRADGPTGVNGSHMELPFGLDRSAVPVVGSYASGEQSIARFTSGWFALPTDMAERPLLVVSAAGRIPDAGSFQVEFAADPTTATGTNGTGEDGNSKDDSDDGVIGSASFIDIGPSPSWRNLRIPTATIPRGATAMRLVAKDVDVNPRNWFAFTAPRVPVLETVDQLIGHTDPVLLDWAMPMAFPCQRMFDEYAGVVELPHWRILPERPLAVSATTTWQGADAGGPLGWAELLLEPTTVPTYMRDDWGREWGAIERYTPLVPDAVPAAMSHTEEDRSGLWSPGLVRPRG